MNEKQLFSVMVRGMGVLIFVYGLQTLYTAMVELGFWGLVAKQTAMTATFTSGLVFGLLALALGAAARKRRRHAQLPLD